MMTLSQNDINEWADSPKGPVALHLKQRLRPVEGDDAVIFPPTYADIGYNVDQLSDGTKVVTIDSVGSQANRMEPIFKRPDLMHLVPQISIRYGNGQQISILDAGHRLGDAVIRSTELRTSAQEAFQEFNATGDPTKLARLGPTSLVFGVWDSRDTQAKLPRIVQAIIRAWDVSPLTRSAQYTPALDYSSLEVFSDEEKQNAQGNTKSPLAQRGFVHVPASGSHGGVFVHGGIFRDVTVNLVALRRLGASTDNKLRRYILGLSLVAAVEPPEAFLRQGCLLVPDEGAKADWMLVDRHGKRHAVALDEATALNYAKVATDDFGKGSDMPVEFSKEKAKADVSMA